MSGDDLLTVREGGAPDIDEIMATMVEAFDPAFGEAWTASQCLGILDLPGVWISLASRNGVPSGFALGRTIFNEAELLLLGVRPGFRRTGIGSALLSRTMHMARALGADRLHLEVRDGNAAHQLYKQAGFVEVGRRRGYYRGASGQIFDALTLSIPLPPLTPP